MNVELRYYIFYVYLLELVYFCILTILIISSRNKYLKEYKVERILDKKD